jgi:hypothetical protein
VPDLFQLAKKRLVILNVPQLIGILIVLLEIPVGSNDEVEDSSSGKINPCISIDAYEMSGVSHKSCRVGNQQFGKPFDRQVVGWRLEVTAEAILASRSNKGRCRILTLQNKLPAKQLIALHVGGSDEFLKNPK